MGNWDWQVYLQDPGGKIPTYWQWMLSAWGWTISVALSALVVALVLGSLVGVIRTLPNSPMLVRFGNPIFCGLKLKLRLACVNHGA